MPNPIKTRHAPFRVLTALLYTSEQVEWLSDEGGGIVRVDRAPMARHLKTSTERLKEAFHYLITHGYMEHVHSERGRSLLKLTHPKRWI